MNVKRFLIQTGIVLCCLALLIGLGTWQLQRKAWKDALLGQLREQTGRVPAAYSSWLARNKSKTQPSEGDPISADLFAPVVVEGRFRHADEVYVFTSRRGQPGYLVFTPFEEKSGKTVLVNRGFVPEHLRERGKRLLEIAKKDVEVRGFIRAPERSGWFTPEPDIDKRIWYIADLQAMAERTKVAAETTHFVEADDTPNPGGWPNGRDAQELLSAIPNKHIGYALTWFGLAVALCIVFGFFVRNQFRRSASEKL